ncbi:hypothetical protein KM043_001162 [Ampulex compressa]|nr:hypothetical protein KM043_001162 [Ampulex compressa]
MCDYCSWIDQILATVQAEEETKENQLRSQVDPVIVVHGGAGEIPRKERDYMIREVKNAAAIGYDALTKGRSSLDAVERAVCHLESSRYFNCGRGGALDINKQITMDAAIMTNDYRAGCVGAVRCIEHPITLARKVMQNTDHTLIVEEGAQKLACEFGIPILSPSKMMFEDEDKESMDSFGREKGDEINSAAYFKGDEEKNEDRVDPKSFLDNSEGERIDGDKCGEQCAMKRDENEENTCPRSVICTDIEESSTMEPTFLQVDAVGAVACDKRRRLSSGTSTAGKASKPSGSTSAIGTAIGCGIFVDENSCAAVSGEDRSILLYAPARKIVDGLNRGESVHRSLAAELGKFESETGESRVGAIALNSKGEFSVSFKCMHFPWACCSKGRLYFGCSKNQVFSEEAPILERPLDCMCENLDD